MKECVKCHKPIDPNSSYDEYGFPDGPKECVHRECQNIETKTPVWYGIWVMYEEGGANDAD